MLGEPGSPKSRRRKTFALNHYTLGYTFFGGWVNRRGAVNGLFFDFLRVRVIGFSIAWPDSRSISPVEGAILDGFGDVFGGEGFHAVQIGDGAGDF